jgi:predicted ester cyclase
MGATATGRVMSVSGMTFFRITDEKLVEGWVMTDQLRLRQ